MKYELPLESLERQTSKKSVDVNKENVPLKSCYKIIIVSEQLLLAIMIRLWSA